MLSAKRDIRAAKRFFKKVMRADHRRLPFSVNVDNNAAYPDAFTASQQDKVLPFDCKLRRVKYLNNIIEQAHRFVKKRVLRFSEDTRPMIELRSIEQLAKAISRAQAGRLFVQRTSIYRQYRVTNRER